jgi:starch synthase
MPVGLNVLVASSEVFPLVKTGGLADVAASLPIALRNMDVDARIIMPAYRGVTSLVSARPACKWFRPMIGSDRVRLLKGMLPGTRVPVYLIDCPSLFDRPGDPYSDQYGQAYPDNAVRFGVLSKVAAMFGLDSGPDDWRADVVHGHDWHCGLSTAYLKFAPNATAASVFTIHNLAYQGNFDRKVRHALGIDSLAFHMDGLEYYGHLSFMKSGIFYADEVTTVSPTYAHEIQEADNGFGMDGVLRHRSGFLHGVLNGIDTDHWDPATEESLPARFSADDHSGKAVCRRHLLEQLGMDAGDPRLVVGMLGRMTAQKGWRLLLGAMPLLIKDGVRVILMGSGNPEYEDKIRRLVGRYPERVAHRPGYDEVFARLLYAGSDALAVPSFFEPCGLVQMYAQRFGTVPIGHHTGGLADTIVDPDQPAGRKPTGFLFSPATPTGLATAIRRAERVFRKSPEDWMALTDNGMRRDFSWERSAQRYVEIYQTALDTRRAEARRSRT